MAVEGCVGNQRSVYFSQKDKSRTGQTEDWLHGKAQKNRWRELAEGLKNVEKGGIMASLAINNIW